jgi:hypothetical protein
MWTMSSVIDTTWLAVAVISAAEEFGVQRVQDVGVDPYNLLAAQEGQDMLIDVTAVGVQRLARHANPKRPIAESIDAAPLTSSRELIGSELPSTAWPCFLGGAEASDSCHH